MAQIAHILGDQCDGTILKNFMKVAEERLIVVRPDGTVDEFFEGWLRAMEGNPSLLKHADDSGFNIASLSENGKTRLKQILSDPNPGDPWKLDDPVWVTGQDPPVPHNYWARGMLLEIDAYKRIYKGQGFDHFPNAAGYDYSGPKWVQIKSLKNPDGAIAAMKKAIDDLVDKAPEDVPLKLHILKRPGTSSTALDDALDAYVSGKAYESRFEFVIDAYDIGVP